MYYEWVFAVVSLLLFAVVAVIIVISCTCIRRKSNNSVHKDVETHMSQVNDPFENNSEEEYSEISPDSVLSPNSLVRPYSTAYVHKSYVYDHLQSHNPTDKSQYSHLNAANQFDPTLPTDNTYSHLVTGAELSKTHQHPSQVDQTEEEYNEVQRLPTNQGHSMLQPKLSGGHLQRDPNYDHTEPFHRQLSLKFRPNLNSMSYSHTDLPGEQNNEADHVSGKPGENMDYEEVAVNKGKLCNVSKKQAFFKNFL